MRWLVESASGINQDMWEKWVQLATLGAVTCLMQGSIGEIMAVKGGSEFRLFGRFSG
jgi:2-dehydropantoate 2-reductase